MPISSSCLCLSHVLLNTFGEYSGNVHSENFLVKWLLDFVLSQVLRGGLVFKQIEQEIVSEGPIKDFSKYRPENL